MSVLTDAERHALAMRLVGDFEARRFHVELSHAVLGGGGLIEGRVHRDREFAEGPIVVRARCMEAWREAPPRVPIVPANRSMRMPRWHERTLWSEEQVLDGLVRRALGGLQLQRCRPICRPAVEARSVAWRYEIEARRPLRLRPDERALAVPLRFRAMLLDPGLPVPLRLA